MCPNFGGGGEGAVTINTQRSIKTVDCMEVTMRMVSCNLKALCYVNVMYMKKICIKFWFFIGDFPRSPSPVRSGNTPCPQASAQTLAHCVLPLGIFKIPSGRGGIWLRIPSKNSEFYLQIPQKVQGFFSPFEAKMVYAETLQIYSSK